MKDMPAGIDQLKLPRAVPGLGDNLLIIARPAAWSARVRCQVCGEEQGCRVVPGIRGNPPDTMDGFSFHFWLAHFQSQHADLLPPEIREEL